VDTPFAEIDDGWDFKVLVLEDEWVVRIPRSGLAVEELVHLIRALGKTAVQRDTLYRPVKVWT